MAAAFVAMNEVYGPLFDVSRAEAQDKDKADARAKALAGQFIMDTHTHFLRDDTKILTFVRQREAVGKQGWNPGLVDKPQTIEDLKFNNYFKEIFLDSDTKVALISSSPSEVPGDWFLTNDMAAEARKRINDRLGARRMMAHAIFTPGYPGWIEEVDRAIKELKPDSMKGYTIGDNTNKNLSKHPCAWTTKSSCTRSTRSARRPGSSTSACTRGCSPRRWSSSSPTCWRTPTCAMSARRRRTGRS